MTSKSESFACPWLVERRNPAFNCPDWYPDSPSDLTVIGECGAVAVSLPSGGWRCENGHEQGSLEEELGPYGREWQREQEERYSY